MTFFRRQERTVGIKDPLFIRECMLSKNYQVRFEKDQPLDVKDVKRQAIARDDERILRLRPDMRYSQLRLGVITPLHKGEADEFLKLIKNDPLPESHKHIVDYLFKRKLKDEQEGEK